MAPIVRLHIIKHQYEKTQLIFSSQTLKKKEQNLLTKKKEAMVVAFMAQIRSWVQMLGLSHNSPPPPPP